MRVVSWSNEISGIIYLHVAHSQVPGYIHWAEVDGTATLQKYVLVLQRSETSAKQNLIHS